MEENVGFFMETPFWQGSRLSFGILSSIASLGTGQDLYSFESHVLKTGSDRLVSQV